MPVAHVVEREVTVTPSDGLEGESCTACGRPLQAGETAVVCPRCKAPHHRACWVDHGGCARRGCPQVALALLPDAAPARRGTGEGEAAARRAAARRRRWLVGVGLLTAALGVVALTWYPQIHRSPEPVISVHVMAWAEPGQGTQVLQETASRYQAAYPARQVTLDLVPYFAYDQKLVVLLMAGDPPDLFALPADRVAFFARQQALADLTKRWETDRPGAPVRVEGRVWGIRHPGQPDTVWVMPAAGQAPDAAWDFIRLLTTAEPQAGPAATPSPRS